MAYKFQLGAFRASGSIIQSSGSVDLKGATVDSLDVSNGGVTNAGSIAGATSIDGSGDLTMGTITMSGFEVDADGDTALKSLKVDDGSTIGSDSQASILTFAASGDLTFHDGAFDFDVASHDGTNGLKLGGTLLAASAAELNNLDGFAEEVYVANADSIVFFDATDSKMKSESGAHFVDAIAGDGLAEAGGSMAVQVSGAMAIKTDKVALSSSIAGAGLEVAADDVSSGIVSSIAFDLTGVAALSGAIHQTEDIFPIFDDGTLKKTSFSNLEDAVFASVGGDATIAAGGSLTIANDAVSADKLQNFGANEVVCRNANSAGSVSGVAVADTQLLIGDGTGFTAATLSGDIAALSNAGAVTMNAAQQNITTILNDSLKLGRGDGNDNIDFGTDDAIKFNIDAGEQMRIASGSVTIYGDLNVQGSTTTIDSANILVTGSISFEGVSNNAHETSLGVVDPTGDRTITLPDESGKVPLLIASMADSDAKVTITATPAELNLLDAGAGSSVSLAGDDAFIIFDATDGNQGKKATIANIASYVGNNASETVQSIGANATLNVNSGAQVLATGNSNYTITLDTPANHEGKRILIKRSGNGNVTIAPNGSELIDGVDEIVLDSPFAAVTILSDGTNYFVA